MQTKAKTRAKKATQAPSAGIENIAPLDSSVAPAIVAAQAEQAETIAYKSGARDAATALAAAYPFGGVSSRDESYIAFFGFAMRDSDSATLATIHNAGKPVPGKPHMRRNPFYNGSAKATDAGVIVRLCKAGLFSISDNGNRLHATAQALSHKAFRAGRTIATKQA